MRFNFKLKVAKLYLKDTLFKINSINEYLQILRELQCNIFILFTIHPLP